MRGLSAISLWPAPVLLTLKQNKAVIWRNAGSMVSALVER